MDNNAISTNLIILKMNLFMKCAKVYGKSVFSTAHTELLVSTELQSQLQPWVAEAM